MTHRPCIECLEIIKVVIWSSEIFWASLYLRAPCFSFTLKQIHKVLDKSYEEEFILQCRFWQDHATVSLAPTTTRPNTSSELSFPCFILPNSGNPQPVALQVQEEIDSPSLNLNLFPIWIHKIVNNSHPTLSCQQTDLPVGNMSSFYTTCVVVPSAVKDQVLSACTGKAMFLLPVRVRLSF